MCIRGVGPTLYTGADQLTDGVWSSRLGRMAGGVQGRLIDESDYIRSVSVFRHDNDRRQVMRPATDRPTLAARRL